MIKYTKHAVHQMNTRGISKNSVVFAIANGVKLVNRTDSNKWTYVDNTNKIYVVTNKESNIVITAFRKN